MNRTGLKNHYINRIVKLSVIASAISLLLLNCSCSIDSVTDTGNSQSSETVTRITEMSSDKTIKLTMFSSTLGIEKSQDNEIRKLIAEKTDVEVIEVWLVGEDADETGLCNTAGFAVTTCCKDPDVAFKFINDILSDEVMELRFWGIEGVDYLVNVDGSYYRTKEMTDNLSEKEYVRDHVCQYQMMPRSRDFCV